MILTRLVHTAHGIIGRMGEWYTLERRWLDNAPNISCIPAGAYRAYRSFYNRGGYPCFELASVPKRHHILIHVGNTEDDSAGCILLGTGVGVVKNKVAVINSRNAHDYFIGVAMKGEDEFMLKIEDWNNGVL